MLWINKFNSVRIDSHVTIMTLQPCCSQSELYQKRRPLASNPGETLFLTNFLPPPQYPAESHIRLSPSSLSSVLYFGSALMVKSAEWCCVLTGLPLNPCLFLYNYSHWWAPRPCGVTFCLLAEMSGVFLSLCGTGHLCCLCGTLVYECCCFAELRVFFPGIFYS